MRLQLIYFLLSGNCLWWRESLCCELDQSLVLKVSGAIHLIPLSCSPCPIVHPAHIPVNRYEDKAIEQNIFISPSSIYHTLMLAYFGALGETQVDRIASVS